MSWSSMWKVKIRRCPKVPLGVSTMRALSSSGRLVGIGPAASGAAAAAARPRPSAVGRSGRAFRDAGANSWRLTRRVSSVRRSIPTRWCAATSTPLGSDGSVPGVVTSAPDSNTRHGALVSWVAPFTR